MKKKTTPKKRSLAFRVFRAVAIVLAVPIVLAGGLIAFLHTGPGQRLILKRVFARLEERVNGTAEIGSLEIALFGDLALRDVVISDVDGEPVIALETLEVTPDWSSLLSGDPILERVVVDGVTLHVVQYEDGSSNLKKLFKPKPPEPPPTEPQKPKDRRLGIESLQIGTVNVDITRPDGTVIALKDFGLNASIDTVPTQKTAKIVVPRISAGLSIEKPEQGLKIDVEQLVTSLEIDVTEGAGTIALGETTASATIAQRGAPERNVDLSLGGITLDVQPGEVNAALEGLAVGALALSSLEVTGRISEGGLEGEQKVQVVGLRVDHDKLNTILGKEVLATDIGLEMKIAGPPEDVVVTTAITTEGGDLTVSGDVDVSDLGEPELDIAISGKNFETEKLFALEAVPPVEVEELSLGLRGHGRSRERAEIDVGLTIQNALVKNHRIDQLRLDARYDGGELEVSPLTVEAYGTRLVARGKIDLIRKLIDVTLTIEGDVGATLERLRAAGLAIETKLPKGALALREDVVKVHVSGDLEGFLAAEVAIDRLAVAGGAIIGDIRAKLFRNVLAGPDDKKVELRDLDGTIELAGINLKHALALRGKKLDGLTGTVSGKVTFDDVPHDPHARYDLSLRAQPSERYALDRHRPMLALSLWGHATERDAWVNVRIDGEEDGDKTKLLTAFAHAPLLISDTYKGVAPYRPLKVKLDMPERKVAELLPYVPPKLLVDKKTGKPRNIPTEGTVFAHVDIGGTGAAPTGDIDLDVHVPVLGDKVQRVKIDGKIDSARPKVALTTGLAVWLDANKEEAIKGTLVAELSKSPLLPGDKGLAWSLDLDILPQIIGELPLPPEKLAGYAGTASGEIHVKGNKTDVTGTVDVKVDGLLARGKGPFNVGVGVVIEDEKIVLDVDAGAGKNKLVAIDGDVARGGKGLIAALRDKTPGKSTVDKIGNPKIDLTVALPEQSTSAYGALSPVLYELPGKLGGKIVVSGDLRTPVAEGGIAYHGFQTLSGKPGRAAVGVVVTPELVSASVDLGPPLAGATPDKGQAPVAIAVSVPREQLEPYSDAKKCHADPQPTEQAKCEAAKLPIAVRIAADDVDIKDLVPAFVLEGESVAFDGRITWSLDASIVLDPEPRRDRNGEPKLPISPESKITGALKFHDGVITIPGTKRQYKDILVAISHDMKEVRVDSVRLRESDLEKPERKLDMRAHLALDDFKPGNLTAHLATRDWLVFGSERVGPADAPRASLTSDIRVKGNLGKPIKTIDVDVQALELLIPDRFDRAHQPEVVSKGDVIYLKRGMTPGKLPVPLIALDSEAEDPFAEEKQKGPETGLDVNVRIPNTAHILQSPMNLYTIGGLTIQRRGNRRSIQGKLDMVGGDLSLGGKLHDLVRGHIVFDEQCKGGCLDLLFARMETPTALRDVSKASAGDAVTIRLEGPLDARVTTLGGAGSPGTLFDLLSMHNAGRPRYYSEPDLPATAATEFPQHFNLLMLSYFSVNAPHLLFLDRVAAWSDAYDGRSTDAYGENRHYRAEGYYADDKLRVRGTMRPPTAGASEGELGFDYMFSNTPQTAIGVGVTVGTRGGGGPGVFFEWSSKD